MNSLYEPRGKAAAFARLAVNIFDECSHGCRYCYCPRILHKSAAQFFSRSPEPRAGLLTDLVQACEEWCAVEPELPPVHLSFIGDPFPRGVAVEPTLAVIDTLHRFKFPVQVLSKSGVREDSVLKALSPLDSYGVTLTTCDPVEAAYWEPFAASPAERAEALACAHSHDIPTWVSLEPVLSPADARAVLEALSGTGVERIWVGPLNHRARPYQWDEVKAELAEVAKAHALPVRWKDEA